MGGSSGRLFAWTIGAAALLLSGEAHAAGGAFVVDDAAIDDPGNCKVESSLSFTSHRDFLALSTPACVVPFIRPVEIGVIAARTRVDDVWGTSLVPKAKMNILPVEVGKFGLAIAGGARFDVLTGQHTESFINVPVTYTFSEALKVNVNGGWAHDRETALHFLFYGAGVEWVPFKPVTLIAEVFGFIGPVTDRRTETEPRFQAGIRVTPIDTIDFDLIYGRNVTGENANWITLGMNVRFPVPGK
jgi:hypothetical protein